MTTWRCRYGSPPRSKITRIAERPWLDVERTVRTFSVPASRPSSGRVTSASTCVASRPGVSVCTSTCGGAKSGNTSKRAPSSAATPSTAISTLSAVMMRGCASDERTIAASISFRLSRSRERPAAGRVREAFARMKRRAKRALTPALSRKRARGMQRRRRASRQSINHRRRPASRRRLRATTARRAMHDDEIVIVEPVDEPAIAALHQQRRRSCARTELLVARLRVELVIDERAAFLVDQRAARNEKADARAPRERHRERARRSRGRRRLFDFREHARTLRLRSPAISTPSTRPSTATPSISSVAVSGTLPMLCWPGRSTRTSALLPAATARSVFCRRAVGSDAIGAQRNAKRDDAASACACASRLLGLRRFEILERCARAGLVQTLQARDFGARRALRGAVRIDFAELGDQRRWIEHLPERGDALGRLRLDRVRDRDADCFALLAIQRRRRAGRVLLRIVIVVCGVRDSRRERGRDERRDRRAERCGDTKMASSLCSGIRSTAACERKLGTRQRRMQRIFERVARGLTCACACTVSSAARSTSTSTLRAIAC